MPSFKNQHFVPQCHLREFSESENSKCISLFHLKSQNEIKKAPIKSQCSKDYFYGDINIEKSFHEFEGNYAHLIKKIKIENNYLLKDEDKRILLNFWYVQYLRTESQITNTLQALENYIDQHQLQEYLDQINIDQNEVIKLIMKNMHCGYTLLDDLECILIKNCTQVPFITSDNPAIITNWFYFKKNITKLYSFGLNSMGTLLILPLTPQYCFLAYDKNSYSITHKQSLSILKKEFDVELINQFQILNANYNVYFNQGIHFSQYYEKYNELRIRPRYKITNSVLCERNSDYETYRVIKPEDFDKYQYTSMITQISQKHSKPNRWPSFIRWKPFGFGFYDDSAIGYVREKYKDMLNPKTRKKLKI